MKKISITRQELYEEVWSTPMIKLAEKYKLTGNGLKKICAKHNIPVPYAGYWEPTTSAKSLILITFTKYDTNLHPILYRVILSTENRN